jgi:AraC-like DNA-binding protein
VDWAPGYREFRPPRGLASALACAWVSVNPPGGAPPTRVLPDGCADLIWRRGTGVFLAGPDTGPVVMPMPPGTVLAGVRFRPGAGGPALGRPLEGLLDQRVGAAELRTELPAGLGAALGRQLRPDLEPAEALRLLVRLAGGLVAERPPDPLVAAAAFRLGRPGAQVGVVAAGLALSERQLNRRCGTAVGYGPALLRRVLRFRRFVSRLDAARQVPDLARLAAAAGYADQAHLTRECGRLAGLTPAALARVRRPPAALARDRRAGAATLR